jgi:hypothetical protein
MMARIDDRQIRLQLARTGGSCRARRRVIVVDASAVLEALLRTPAAAAVEERLFDLGETLMRPT